MTFNNPFFINLALLSLYQQSHDLTKEAYSHGGDADVRVCGPSNIFLGKNDVMFFVWVKGAAQGEVLGGSER